MIGSDTTTIFRSSHLDDARAVFPVHLQYGCSVRLKAILGIWLRIMESMASVLLEQCVHENIPNLTLYGQNPVLKHAFHVNANYILHSNTHLGTIQA